MQNSLLALFCPPFMDMGQGWLSSDLYIFVYIGVVSDSIKASVSEVHVFF